MEDSAKDFRLERVEYSDSGRGLTLKSFFYYGLPYNKFNGEEQTVTIRYDENNIFQASTISGATTNFFKVRPKERGRKTDFEVNQVGKTKSEMDITPLALAIVQPWGLDYAKEIIQKFGGILGVRSLGEFPLDGTFVEQFRAQYIQYAEKKFFNHLMERYEKATGGVLLLPFHGINHELYEKLSHVKDYYIRPTLDEKIRDMQTSDETRTGLRLSAVHTPRNIAEARRELKIWAGIIDRGLSKILERLA